MNPKDFSIEDFVLDKFFREWVLKPDRESNVFWEQYLKEHPYQVDIMEKARQIILNLPRIHQRIAENEVLQMWNNIKSGMENSADQNINVIPIHSIAVLKRQQEIQKWWFDYKILGKYAAVVLLFVTAIVSWYLVNQQPEIIKTRIVVKETQWGQKLIIYLSDGSEVMLNSGSTIEYPEHFTPDERVVFLNGEAFFKVAKDQNRPFKVITSKLTTEALGTSFNINAYPGSGTVDVSLVSGKVMVYHDTSKLIQLVPGESANYDGVNNTIEKAKFDPAFLRWKDGIIVFKDDNQETVFKKLSESI